MYERPCFVYEQHLNVSVRTVFLNFIHIIASIIAIFYNMYCNFSGNTGHEYND